MTFAECIPHLLAGRTIYSQSPRVDAMRMQVDVDGFDRLVSVDRGQVFDVSLTRSILEHDGWEVCDG